MVIYYKQDRRAKAELPLWVIAIELGIMPDDVKWKCRGSCYKKTMRDPPMTNHVRMTFPSGTIRYQCRDCGSAVVFNDSDEEQYDVVPEEQRESFISNYKHKEVHLKEVMRTRNGKKKNDS